MTEMAKFSSRAGRFLSEKESARRKRLSGRMKCQSKESETKSVAKRSPSQADDGDAADENVIDSHIHSDSDSCILKPEAERFQFDTRQIVELGVLSEHLDMKGCTVCKKPLQLCNTVGQQRYGLGHLLYIQCTCGALNSVPTGKRHHNPAFQKTMPAFDINTKVTAGKSNF